MTQSPPNSSAPQKKQALPAETVSVPEQIQIRYRKRQDLLEKGQNPYKNGYERTAFAKDLHLQYGEKSREELEQTVVNTSVCGRVMNIRDFGKGGFVRISESSGEMQLFLDKKELGDEAFERFKQLDFGDFIFGEGRLFKTRTGELSVHCTRFELLTKSLRPLPEKFHGLADVETRYRQRYADLIVSEKVRETFIKRSKIVDAIRRFLVDRGFLEVETPMLHSIQGGTIAKPFKTHHNALDMELFLRIAPELYLKRLVVGGMERVFEINRNFRNEGISIKHNPEFTMLEFYQAYATFEDLMPLTQQLFWYVADSVHGSRTLEYQGTSIELDGDWTRLTVEESILKYSGFKDATLIRDRHALLAYGALTKNGMSAKQSTGELQMAIFDAEVEAQLIQPTFVTHYPLDVSPLARKNEKDPYLTDRFEFFIYGREIGNAFSELNDPVDQRERFQKQVEAKMAGNDEACDMDEDYIRALEYGLPPTAGEGIGIDRMVMLFTDAPSIRDVVLFPLLRHE